jgi:hypothetical protein
MCGELAKLVARRWSGLKILRSSSVSIGFPLAASTISPRRM